MHSGRRVFAAAFWSGLLLVPASAVDVTECARMLEADDARLACYDRIVTAEIKRQEDVLIGRKPTVEVTVSAPPAAPKQAVALAPVKERSFKRIDPADVRNSPDKWQDRDIEFATVQIYWVSDEDLRILTDSNLTLFARKPLGDPADIAYLRENCETSKEASTSKCRIRVRFKYIRHGEDNPGGMFKRVVLAAPEVEVVRLGKQRR